MMAKKKSVKKTSVARGCRSQAAGRRSKKDDLTIHFMPYSEIAREDAIGRVKKIMNVVLDGRIVILQGRLKAEEETKLIENSMMMIGNVAGFAGVEIATLSGEDDNRTVFEGIRRNIARILVGEQDAITVIGPASVVGEMKKDPKKVELLLSRK